MPDPEPRDGGEELWIMSAPAAPGHDPGQNPRIRPGTPGSFEGVVDRALRDRALGTNAPPSPVDPEPRALLRYVAGRSTADERPTVESWLTRSSWAYDRVLALVRAARKDAPPLARALAGRLGDAPTAGAAVAAAVLEERGERPGDFQGALDRLSPSDDAPRAALLLGLGRYDEAQEVLSSKTKNAARRDADPLAEMLRRLASLPAASDRDPANPDQALLVVLDAFPALLENGPRGRERA
jgi:hypothetical protein